MAECSPACFTSSSHLELVNENMLTLVFLEEFFYCGWDEHKLTKRKTLKISCDRLQWVYDVSHRLASLSWIISFVQYICLPPGQKCHNWREKHDYCSAHG